MDNDKAFDVVVVGNIGVDTNVYAAGNDIDFDVEANFTENIDYVGQAGAYTARGFAQLGKRTAFIGYIGDDHNGNFVLEVLKHDQINTSAVFTDPAGTSRSVNFMYRDGRRKNFYDGKSHMTLQPDLSLCRAILEQTRLVHFNIPNWARALLPIAQELGVTISCDLQDVVSFDDPYRQDFIEYADILFFSAVNLRTLPETIASLLINKPNRIIVAGMGSQGCALGAKYGIRYFEAVDMPEPIIDTNGAGDGLAVGFLTSYVLDQLDLEEAIWRGQITARYTCTQRASTSHLITLPELNALYQQLKK